MVGAMTGLIVAAALTAFAEIAGDVYDARLRAGIVGASLAFLLLAPSLVSYVLSRGVEHAFAARSLAGVRLLTVTSVLLSVGAGALLVASVAQHDRSLLIDGVASLRNAALVVAAILVAGAVLPLGRRWQRRD